MTTTGNDMRCRLPKMDRLLAWPELAPLVDLYGRRLLRVAARSVLETLRRRLERNPETDLSPECITALIRSLLQRQEEHGLRRVINGSGVVLHTNLGRSPLPAVARRALLDTAWGYSNLEFDLDRGERGERYAHVEELICEITGAEAALVVNNNAAAVLLCLSALATGREVIVSRGELVEIGGSFRIPDVMAQSGALLVEVGTTNRTHPRDYSRTVTERTALLLKVHTSNFAQVGFTAETDTAALAAIGRETAIPVMVDAGSGCLLDMERFGITGETTVRGYLRQGADVVTFSGDKLLGGPQAGLIVGRADLVRELKKHPLLRALRIDKLTLAALQATLRLYRDEYKAMEEIPTLKMLTMPLEEIIHLARRMMRRLRAAAPPAITLRLHEGVSTPGGGSLPLVQLPTRLIEVTAPPLSAHHLEELLRTTTPPVIGRIRNDRLLLDVRTMTLDDIPLLAAALRQALETRHG